MRTPTVLALLPALLLVPAAADAATIRTFGSLALSPAGDRIATLESVQDLDANTATRAVVTLREATTGRVVATYDPCATCGYSDPTFAPDGTLAFLARDRAAGTARLMVAPRGRAVRAVATVTGLANTPRFAPDGRRVALLVTLGASKETGAVQAGARQVGEIGEHVDAQRLAVVDLASGALRQVSPEGRYVYEYDWTPDGRGFVATAATGNGDANWWVATLDAIDAASGAVRTIARPAAQANYPRVSPDGRSVAFIGGVMSDFGSVGGDVYTVAVTGCTPANATPGMAASATSIQWTRGGLRAGLLRGADAVLAPIEPGRPLADGWARPASFGAGDGRAAWSADGRTVATVVQSFDTAPAIWVGTAGAQPRQLTHDNDAAPRLTRATSVTWRSGPYQVQGWLLAPATAASDGGKAPMIVDVHGGPAAAHQPRYLTPGLDADLLLRGYWLFKPNPRGSYGQGAAFAAANRRDFGGGDLADILAGVDAVVRGQPVDGRRLGLMGASYGGFMAMWANTRTDRFKAIVAGAGIANWISYYGTNGIDEWMLPYFGKSVYDDVAAYQAVSAIYFAGRARTPTFIWAGERDIEVPASQSLEWYKALRAHDVAASLVIYADEGHGVRQPANAADLRRRTVAWFDRYLAR
jgi:dipeptidyl aminopeptidase/acylaminoacyl peptidase